MFAEAVWLPSENGEGILPLEIAMAKSPSEVYIFEITPPEHIHWKLFHFKGFRNKDRFYNSTPQRSSPILPIHVFVLNADTWLTELVAHLERLFPHGSLVKVRGKSQFNFFSSICKFPMVRRIKIPTGIRVMGCLHKHMSPYPCAGIEVRTMARHFSKLFD